MARAADEHRAGLERRLAAAGYTMRQASVAIGRNTSYLRQYIKEATPRFLPERERQALADLLQVDEALLKEPTMDQRGRTPAGINQEGIPPADKVVARITPRGSPYRPNPLEEGRRDLPVFGVAGGAPDALFLDPGDIKDMVPRPRHLDKVQNAYAVYHAGESMEPRYHPDEILHVDPNRPIRSGCYVVAQFTDRTALVKQYVRQTATHLICRQLNPEKELEFPLDEIVAIHRIVGTAER